MHIKDVKDISGIAKDIKDLTEQKKNPTREGMEKVIKSVREHLILETERNAKETDLLYKNVQKHLHELRIRALNCVCYPDDVKQYVLFLGFWRDHKTNDGAFVMAASKKMKVGRPMPRSSAILSRLSDCLSAG